MNTESQFSKCYKCFRPAHLCYCSSITSIQTGVHFVFLMHPKEAYQQKTGTGRLASLSLNDSEIIVGINFTDNFRVNEMIRRSGEFTDYYPVLLYPRDRAFRANSADFAQIISGKKLLVFVIDATWFFAKKMLKVSLNLHNIPTVSFGGLYRSRFDFKKQPSKECLSTIESCYYLLEELKQSKIVGSNVQTDSLMTVFKKMVDFQLLCEQRRHETLAADLFPELFQRQ